MGLNLGLVTAGFDVSVLGFMLWDCGTWVLTIAVGLV